MTPEDIERLRRSIAMLPPQATASMDRERALDLIEELQRLDQVGRRYEHVISELHTLLATLD